MEARHTANKKMGRHYRGEVDRLSWVDMARMKGLRIAKVNPTTYLINGKMANIKVRHMSPGKNEYWFSVSQEHLLQCDVFIWICDRPDKFCAIGKREMQLMTAKSRQFNITEDLTCLKAGGEIFAIGDCRGDMGLKALTNIDEVN
jgi:hypothetical protein